MEIKVLDSGREISRKEFYDGRLFQDGLILENRPLEHNLDLTVMGAASKM